MYKFILLVLAAVGCNGNSLEIPRSYYDGCMESRGCYGYPDDCAVSKDCDVLVSFANYGTGVSFKMSGLLHPSQYMAVGFSYDQLMGNDSVVECFLEGSKAYVRRSFNMGNSNHLIKTVPSKSSADYRDGVCSCSWNEEKYIVKISGTKFDLINSKFHILLAKGPMENFERKQKHTEKLVSKDAVNLTIYGNFSENRRGDIPIEEFTDASTVSSTETTLIESTTQTEIQDSTETATEINGSTESSTINSVAPGLAFTALAILFSLITVNL